MLLHYLGNRKPTIASFHLNAKCCFANRHTKHVHIIIWSWLNHPSLAQESSVCIKQNLGREYSIATVCYHTLIVYQVCRDVDRCVKSGSCS